MKRTILAAALLAAATTHVSSESALNNNEVLTKIPDASVLQNADKAFMIDAKTLLAILQDPDPAMNNPDKVSWELFVQVNAPAASGTNNNVLFETWATNEQTFTQNPVWPPANPNVIKKLRVPALVASAPRRPGLSPHVVAGGGEEVRRNKAAFDFIKSSNLFTRAGLKTAFTQKKDIQFPTDSIEVKAVWIDAKAGMETTHHVNTASDGKKYALVAMHIISKQVPNWTWATFEHKDNAGRCDIMGCRDNFGATQKVVNPKTPAGQTYPACAKTAALTKMMTDGKLEAPFANYCLKGSQVDFTTASGLVTLLGNSVIESGFVASSSCLTCHSRAAVNSAGSNMYPPAGFINGASPNGPPLATWFWNNPGKPNQSLKALQTDFVWSIPREAI